MLSSNATNERHHGGMLNRAAEKYGIAVDQWVDLSTGINPCGWKVGPLPDSVWARLPEDDDGLLESARDYYQTSNLLAVAGSQAVIQALPFLRKKSRILMLTPSYAEHAYAWRSRGHMVRECKEFDAHYIDALLPQTDVLIIVNPNNPSAQRFKPETLLHWRQKLVEKNGCLVVDEAYIDAQPENSLLPHCPLKGLIVLRSLGKFFGLAGLRLGFVAADSQILNKLSNFLGPWAVNGPARWIAKQALSDSTWQRQTRQRLQSNAERLYLLLSRYGLKPSAGCELFQWLRHDDASSLFHFFAERGILTRLFQKPLSLRFGLPGEETHWRKLEQALSQLEQQFRSHETVTTKFRVSQKDKVGATSS